MKLFLTILIPILSMAQSHASRPYSGEEKRAIKALSASEIEGYLAGRGLGFAKAAELNHYPGPMHVLEHEAELQLTPAQKIATRKIMEETRAEAIKLGTRLVEGERELDELFASEKITETSLTNRVDEIARIEGALRAAHLKAHVRMKKVLSASQVARYDQLRGYASNVEHHRAH
jgi:Spy/CpxP family protein refolding chaperone